MSPRRIQSLVNAQVEVNRAVFEANKRTPDEGYIVDRICAAQLGLRDAKWGKRQKGKAPK